MTVRLVLVAVLALLAGTPSSAHAAGAGLWRTEAGTPPARHDGNPRAVAPTRFRALTVDHAGLRELLADAPATISLPRPGGGFARFAVRPSDVMAPELAAKHPEIATYAGQGVDDPHTSVHLDLSPIGFHASVRGPGGTWYVDPYYRRDRSLYASYHGRALPRDAAFDEGEIVAPDPTVPLTDAPRLAGDPVPLRTYRLALLTDPTYAAYHGAANVRAAKVALTSRVSQVYEDDLGIRLQLIDADLELNTQAEMTGPDGPCGDQPCFTAAQASSCTGATLDRTILVLGLLAGAGAFDVGHLGLGTNGGGIAYLGVAGESAKAGGCTGTPTPVGDAYAVDYVAHELGHQFSGSHTFNGVEGNCSGNRSAFASVEPGSGSSVMAYAGICASDDLQDHSDPYFSQRSLQEATAHVSAAPSAFREAQTVALRDYAPATDAFRLTFNGAQSAPITGGTYSAASLRTAIQGLTGESVTVAGFGGGSFDATGFDVRFADSDDHPELGITALSGATGFVGTTVQGGPATNGGSAVSVSANDAPAVSAPADATIPVQTPFRLVGSATDADGDPLTYSWEQNDSGGSTGTRLLAQPKAGGPLFRQFGTAAAPAANAPSPSPERVFPDYAQVAANTTNAATGSCPAGSVECFSEFLPTPAYAPPALHFRLTARDGRTPAGGVAFDDVTLTLSKSAGPFLVTGPDSGEVLPAGGPTTVTWNVAGTAAAPVNAADVEIRLSTDGGRTFPAVLAASTPNDGSATVTLPSTPTTRARIQVASVPASAAVQRVAFFDVSDADLTIGTTPAPVLAVDPGSAVQYSDAFATPPRVSAYDTDASTLTISAPRLPAGLSLTEGPARTWTVTGTTTAAPGLYDVRVTVTDGSGNTDAETLRVVVTPEAATAAYTGEVQRAAAESAASATVGLAAKVTETADGTPGDLTTATVAFRRDGATLCTAPVAADGSAACAAELPQGQSAVTVEVGGRYAGTAQQTVTVTGGAGPVAQPTAVDPPARATMALLRPDLRDVARRPEVSRTGRFTVPVSCKPSTSGAAPDRCAGVVVVTAKVAGERRTIARRTFDVAAGRTARVRLRLSKAARRALRSRRLDARLSVAVRNRDARTASAQKALVLRRR